MAAHAVSKTLVGLTALAAGSAAALVWATNPHEPRGAAADPDLEVAQRGESGMSLGQEEVAVAAVRAYLRDARVEGLLLIWSSRMSSCRA
jgi:hypothetical protein